MLCCTGMLALSISVLQPGRESNAQHSTAVMDLLLKPPTLCSHRAAKLALTMTPLEVKHIVGSRGRDWVSHNIWSYKSQFVKKELNITKDGDKKYLSHTRQDNEVFIHYPLWLIDI